MSKESERPDRLLTESEVRRILERAARLESGRGSLSVSELENVAEEAGFNRESISRAIDEVLTARDLAASGRSMPATQAAERHSRGFFAKTSRWVRMLASAAVGGVAAFVAAMAGLGSPNVAMLAAVVLVAALLSRAVHHRRDGDMEAFQREAAGTWAGFATVWLLTEVRIVETVSTGIGVFLWERVLLGIAVFWLATAVAGALIIQTGRNASGDEAVSRAGR